MATTDVSYQLSSIAALLREDWATTQIQEQFANEATIADTITTTSSYVQKDQSGSFGGGIGLRAVVPVETVRAAAYTRPELGTLPQATKPTNRQAQYTLNGGTYLKVLFSGISLEHTATSDQAIVQEVKRAITTAGRDAAFDFARQVYGKGDAILARCAATTTSTTINLNATDMLDASRRGTIFVGQTIDIGTAASPTSLASGRTITAVSFANNTITIDGATISTTTSEAISLYGNRAASSVNYEMTGLQALCAATGIIGNIDPSTEPTWAGNTLNNSGTLRNVSLTLMLQAYRSGRQPGGRPTKMLSDLGVYHAVYLALQSQVHFYGGNKVDADVPDSIPVAGVGDLRADIFCPSNKIFFLDLEKIHIHAPTSDRMKWLNGGEPVWNQTQDAYIASARMLGQLGTSFRKAHAMLDDLNE